MAFGATLSAEVDSASSRKSRGAFFTPPQMADLLCSWAIRSSSDCVLDPACGEAEFLVSAGARLRELGARPGALSEQIGGCELHDETAAAAVRRCEAHAFSPRIRVGDFLETDSSSRFDAVVGNPPYVRFQSIGPGQQKTIQSIAARAHVRISALSSSWVPFVFHASSFLKRGGRLAFVLPAELMTVNYASSVRSFLLKSFSEVTVATFDEQVFPEVQEEVVLLFADGHGEGPADHVTLRSSETIGDFPTARVKRFRPEGAGARWTAGLAGRDSAVFLDGLASDGFGRLDDWGTVRLGAVTGNNGFFTLSDEQLGEWGLAERDVIAISPAGSRHLRTLEFTAGDFAALRSRGKKTWLFYPGDDLSKAARRYIEHGEELGIPKGYKCRNRSPWWKVPLSERPDAFITYMNDYAPQICANRAGVRHLNSVHGIVFSEDERELGTRLLPLASINSATLLSSEIEGRAYGGGVLKVEPREAARLLVPSPELVRACGNRLGSLRDRAQELLRGGDLTAVRDLVDSVLAEAVPGFRESLETLRDDKRRLYERRRARGKKK